MVRDCRPQRPGAADGRRTRSQDRGDRKAARHTRFRGRTGQLRGRPPGDKGRRVMNELAGHTLVQAADLVASGQTTSLELLRACWANLDAVNPQVNAIIWQEREQAETAARAADEVVRNKGRLGLLHG